MSQITAQVGASVNGLMREFDAIVHNLANVSTTGYKRICNSFAEALMEKEKYGGSQPDGIPGFSASLDFSQGNIVQTGRGLDFALYGKGFFVLETPEGPLYTRNGMFFTDGSGQIVDAEGRLVAGQAGAIVIPATASVSEITVSNDGNIRAGQAQVGKFKVVDFGKEESKLVAAGLNCYQMPEKGIKAADAEKAIVKQGCYEASNVKMVDELADMIIVCRLYDANMRFLTAQRETSNSIMSVAMG